MHRNHFTVWARLENGRMYLQEWKLGALPQFVTKLPAEDEITVVEVTGNTRLFTVRWSADVERVAVANTNPFRLTNQSGRKTDAIFAVY